MRDINSCYYAGTTVLLGAFLAGVILYLLPDENSPVSFSRTYHTHVETLQTYVSDVLVSELKQIDLQRFADLLPSLLRLDRPHYTLSLTLDRDSRVARHRLCHYDDPWQDLGRWSHPDRRRLRFSLRR